MTDGQKYWDTIYGRQPFGSGKDPCPLLVDFLPRLQKGKVLEIAMGEGQNSVYLASKGFEVRGFDWSQAALDHAQTLAREQNVAIETKRTDLDLFLMGLMEYETIVMTYFKPAVPRYYSEIIRALKQGGTLLVESFMSEEMRDPIGKDELFKDFYFGPNELLGHLKGLRILFYHEGKVDGRYVVQCLAQKPLDRDAVRYNLFDMHVKHADTARSPAVERAESLFKKT